MAGGRVAIIADMPARPTLLPPQIACLALLLLAIVAMPRPAQAQADLHAAEAALEGAGERALAAAFAEALGRVLVKVTGRRDASQDPRLRQAIGDPAALVQQYRLAGPGRVRVQFDPVALRRRLDAVDLPVWGEARPVTLVLVVVPGPDGIPELLELSRAPAPGAASGGTGEPGSGLQPEAGPEPEPEPLAGRLGAVLAEVGAERGIELVQPLLDFQDLATVNADELDAGMFNALPEAARRYGAEAVLVGQAETAVGERLRWTLLVGGDELAWSGGLAEGPHGLADRLAQRLATSRSGLQPLRLLVGEVASLEGWGRLNAYLASLGIIESYRVERVSGDRMLLALEVRGDADRLVRTLALQRVLEPMLAEPPGDGADLAYRLVGWP
jgi:hypothetical protein